MSAAEQTPKTVGGGNDDAHDDENAKQAGAHIFQAFHEVLRFKLHDVCLLSEEFCEITNTATKYNMPVCLHLTENNDRQYLGKTSTDNNSAYQLALRQPNAKFIFAHWSGLDAIAKADFTLPKNVFIDSAATPLLCPNAWEVGIKNFPQQAIFGSDYPLRLYPRKFREPELATIVMDAKKNMQTGYAENFFSSNLEKILSCANR